jgi:putative transposase
VRKSKFTEEQIIEILQEQGTGMRTADVCAKHGISQPTFYGWKSRYSGLSVSNAKKLKQLREENGNLRRLLAEALLDNAVLKTSTPRKG